jgi:hypothetical protein
MPRAPQTLSQKRARADSPPAPQLTLRSWTHSEENKRRTLQRTDISAAISKTDIFDFLVDIVPREDGPKLEGAPDAPPGPDMGAAGAYGGQMPHGLFMMPPGMLPPGAGAGGFRG